jgi:alpha-aminoadipic semialdehyde synthase
VGSIIGIRREDKNEWERRVPLTPTDLIALRERHGLHAIVQASPIRAYTDTEYRRAGIDIAESTDDAELVFAIKEIPTELLRPNTRYVFFSHVIKGQTGNMPMLRRLLDLNCTLIDYERIVDEHNRRLIFFGVHAGHAGMIETLWCLQRRLEGQGTPGPFGDIRHAYQYDSLAAAKRHLREIGEQILSNGLDEGLRPLVFGIAGYGNVSRGAQEVLDCLPVTEVSPGELAEAAGRDRAESDELIKVVFKEQDMVAPLDPTREFDLQHYYDTPADYMGRFEDHLPYLDVLVNTIYWTERYPRLVTREWADRHYTHETSDRLQVIGDISCDIEGSIELTTHAAEPDAPCYTRDPETGSSRPGCDGRGPAIMAVDNLPCELPRESSQDFSRMLRDMVPALAGADWEASFEGLDLPAYLKRAVIAHNGQLTPEYRYLATALDS